MRFQARLAFVLQTLTMPRFGNSGRADHHDDALEPAASFGRLPTTQPRHDIAKKRGHRCPFSWSLLSMLPKFAILDKQIDGLRCLTACAVGGELVTPPGATGVCLSGSVVNFRSSFNPVFMSPASVMRGPLKCRICHVNRMHAEVFA